MSAGLATGDIWFPDQYPDRAVGLYCFPHSGGGTTWYRQWRAHCPEWLGVTPILLSGREIRLSEPPVRDARVVVEHVLRHLPGWQPVALLGHSMGALLAFELARRLTAVGRPPVHLFVSGCPAPWHRRVRRLSDRPFAEIRAYLAELGGTPADVLAEAELMSIWEPALRGDLAIVERYTYRPGPALTCPVSVLTGDDDPVTADDAIVDEWRAVTTGPCQRLRYPGDHAFPLTRQGDVMRDVAAALHTWHTGGTP